MVKFRDVLTVMLSSPEQREAQRRLFLLSEAIAAQLKAQWDAAKAMLLKGQTLFQTPRALGYTGIVAPSPWA